jgi:DNA-damage-inducible protein D
MNNEKHSIALFHGKEIRKAWYQDEWRFVILDVVAVLSESKNPSWYLKDMRKRDSILSEGWGQIATLLSIQTPWWKQNINCANTQWILRIIQSIPSPNAEPFKQRLAQVGYERIQEINDPELSMQRMIAVYEQKWYPKERIEMRMRWIPVRKWLTKERDERWWERAYGVLTNEIYKAYAGMDAQEWMEKKWVKNGNLRDGMSPTELILTMLAEQATTDITKARDTKWVPWLKKSAKDGWWVAWKARQELIEQTGKDPITGNNYLEETKNK